MLFNQVLQPPLTQPAGGNLRRQIALALARCADVGKQHGHHVALQLAPAGDEHRRDAQAFLINLFAQAHGSGHRAADVGMMRAVGDIEQRGLRPAFALGS